MAYFVSEGERFDSAAARASADLLSSSTTLVFSRAGDYWLRIDAPLIGEQIAVLSDVTLSYGVTNRYINVADTGTPAITFYQLQRFNQGVFFSSISESSKQKDEILKASYPNFQEYSYFDKLIVGAGRSTPESLNEFYLKISGSPGALDEVNDGRVLVTRGEILGKRDTAWGNWLDSEGSESPLSEEAQRLQVRLTEQITQREALENNIDDAITRLGRINKQIESAELLLSGMTEIELLSMLNVGLTTSKFIFGLSLDAAAEFFPAIKIPKIILGSLDTYLAYKKFEESGSKRDLAKLELTGFNLTATVFDAPFWVKFPAKFTKAALDLEDIYKYTADLELSSSQTTTNRQMLFELKQKQSELIDMLNQLKKEKAAASLDGFKAQSIGENFGLFSEKTALVVATQDGTTLDLSNEVAREHVSLSFQGSHQTAIASAGTVRVDGGAGHGEMLKLNGSRASYVEVIADTKLASFANQSLTALTYDVERVRFDDGILAFDVLSGQNAGNAYRIYKAAFDRDPDQQGVTFWTKWLDDGKTDPWNMAARFIDSNEFRDLYGSSKPANADYLTKVYTNVLDRAPESDGYNWWLERLNNGTFSQSEVLARFSDSVENRENVAPTIFQGVFLANEYFTF